MPKKKTTPKEETMRPMEELSEQTGFETPPQDGAAPESSLPEEPLVETPAEMDGGQLAAADDLSMEPQGPAPMEDIPMAEDFPAAESEQLPPEPAPVEQTVPSLTRPMTDRQTFFAMDFREMDRGLTAEERQAWNSIYASFRGRSALSGRIIGADPTP